MNKTKLLIIGLAAFSTAATATAITVPIVMYNKYKDKEPEKKVSKKLVLNTYSATIKVGETLKLNPSIEEVTTNTNCNSSNDSYSWSSDDINIATVDRNGLITAKKYGSTSIRVFSDGMFAKCDITVKDDEYHDLDFTYSLIRILKNDGGSFSIPYTCSSKRDVKLIVSDTNKLVESVVTKGVYYLNTSAVEVGDKIEITDSLSKGSKCIIEVIPSNRYLYFSEKVDVGEMEVYCSDLYSEDITEAIIPSIYGGKFVTSFCKQPHFYTKHSFYSHPNLKKVEIPSTIRNMDYAFYNCGTNVSEGMEVTFLDECKVTDICFDACNIKSINIPSSVVTIRDDCFSECSNLSSVTFSPNSSLMNIKKGAFYSCKKLTSIEIPESCKYIEAEAFKDCVNLTSVKLPSSLINVIGESSLLVPSTFHNCHSLNEAYIDSYEILASSTRIEGLFDAPLIYVHNNVNLFNVDSYFTNKYTYQSDEGDYKLYTRNINKCNSYQYIFDEENLECKVFYFNGSALYSDHGIVFPEYFQYDGSETKYTISKIGLDDNKKGFKDCQLINYLKLSKTIKEIEDSSFENCGNLFVVDLNEGLTTIGMKAFCQNSRAANIGLRYINIPSTVTSIGQYAFQGNNYLDTVKIDSTYAANLTSGSNTYLYDCAKTIKVNNKIALNDNSIIKINFQLTSSEGDYDIYTKK